MDIWVGVFVVIGFAALLFLALRASDVASSNLGETYRLKARFDNIGGLKVRGPVKSAGVVVGRVAKISLDPKDYEAIVTMKIDKRYRFPKDTYASILTSGLLGEQYIGLDIGGDEKMLNPGEIFARTQSAIVLEKLIGQFMFSKAAEGTDKK
jgi:phospholipid/cholesterol/gamma-HCH transport system substrate-binding protein